MDTIWIYEIDKLNVVGIVICKENNIWQEAQRKVFDYYKRIDTDLCMDDILIRRATDDDDYDTANPDVLEVWGYK